MDITSTPEPIGHPTPNTRLMELKQQIFLPRKLCPHRARLVTESYRETEGQPAVLQRARALEKVLIEMPVYIAPGELIVGNHASTPQGVPVFPEFSSRWIEDQLEEFDSRKYVITCGEPEARELRKILPYWQGRTVYDRMVELFEERTHGMEPWEEERAREELRSDVDGLGHISLDHGVMLSGGLIALEEKINRHVNALDPSDPERDAKRELYEAMLISSRAVVAFAHRFADLAERMAEGERNLVRRDELHAISANCRRVPEHPPETFWQALQAFWFVHLVTNLESNGHAIGPGRFDQYLYPYYSADVREGRLTRERALELIGCSFIKIALIGKLRSSETSESYAGHSMFQNLTIGGQNADGEQVVNELSYLVLDAIETMKLIQPTVSLRYHPDMPAEFLHRAMEVISTGGGMPAIFGDRRIIETFTSRGVPLEEAREFSMMGCVVPFLPGKSAEVIPHADVPPTAGGYTNLPQLLLLALNDGKDIVTGKRLGPATGKPSGLANIEDVFDLLREQMRFSLASATHGTKARCDATADVLPRPWLSMLVKDCIETGLDLRRGGARYNFSPIVASGLPNLADSLAAVQQFVFKEKLLTMEELLELLRTNFEGRESIQQMLHNRSPKYGNDIELVDALAERCTRMYAEEVKLYDSPGFWAWPFLQTIAKHVSFGRRMGATPDGRLAGQPIADGGVSPVYGMDRNGPTAVLRTVSRMHGTPITASLLNMKFSPLALHGDGGIDKLVTLVRTYFEMGGHHIQFNFVDGETLRAAQDRPEQYADLVVRVAGFSAYFTQLERALQDEIIARTEQVV